MRKLSEISKEQKDLTEKYNAEMMKLEREKSEIIINQTSSDNLFEIFAGMEKVYNENTRISWK